MSSQGYCNLFYCDPRPQKFRMLLPCLQACISWLCDARRRDVTLSNQTPRCLHVFARPATINTGVPREKQASYDLSRPRRLVLLRAPRKECTSGEPVGPVRSLIPFRRQQTGIIRAPSHTMGTPTRIMLAAFFTHRFGNINHRMSYQTPDPFHRQFRFLRAGAVPRVAVLSYQPSVSIGL